MNPDEEVISSASREGLRHILESMDYEIKSPFDEKVLDVLWIICRQLEERKSA